MTDHYPNSWEPDPRQVGKNWQDMFRDPRREDQPPGQATSAPAMAMDEPLEEDEAAIDLVDYKPWIIQRVRSRPALMLELRRHEARSGLWQGWAMPYHSLYAIEYTCERMLSLDFGSRQFLIEGSGLGQLLHTLQRGQAIAIQEYSAVIWPVRSAAGALITAIRLVKANNA